MGCHAYNVGPAGISITNGDHRFLSIIPNGSFCQVYRFTDHTRLDNPLSTIQKPITELTQDDVISVIQSSLH